MIKFKVPKSSLVRFGIFIGLLLVPLVILVLLFSPFASRKTQDKMVEKYWLPDNYSIADVRRVIDNMRTDGEFQFYFLYLDPPDLEEASRQAVGIILENRGREVLMKTVRQQHQSVEALAALFLSINYPSDFAQQPLQYPSLYEKYRRFLREEFVLAVVGLCYKANYDPQFSFHWNQDSRNAAKKLQNMAAAMQRLKTPP